MAGSGIKPGYRSDERQKAVVRIFWTLLTLIFIASMVIYPKIVFEGAVVGLKTWWNIVFPSLLPFFIASELLSNLGFVVFMGTLLEPVMRPLFNLPGAASFVVAVGYTSGYPIGSMVTAKLRSQRLCTRLEAERLMSFTNNSSPLFMLVAVSVGMFNNPSLGIVIAGAHYLSSLTLGLGLRFYGRKDPERIPGPAASSSGIVSTAFRRMMQIQREDSRPLGKIMGEAVSRSITNLLNIGGFIILFAVIIRLLTASGFIHALANCLGSVLLPLGFSPEILPALTSGIFEMTIGSKLSSEAAAPVLQQVVAVGMILAWSGLCVHAQAASMIAGTDIRILPFIISRVVHTCLAGIYTYFAYKWATPLEVLSATASGAPGNLLVPGFGHLHFKMFGIFLVTLLAAILFGLLYHLAVNLKSFILK